MDNEKILGFPDLDAIEREAAMWIARLDGGDLCPADRESFDEWQGRSVHHREAVARLGVVWAELGALKHSPELLKGCPTCQSAPDPRRRSERARPARGLRSAAAIAAMTAVLAVALSLKRDIAVRESLEPASYQTDVGSQKTIPLADGSSILLNTASRVDVRLSRRERDVYLRKGEAYFEVAPDKNRPFLVFAGSSRVRAVGTAFAVRLSDSNVEVTVTKGQVEFAALSEPDAGAARGRRLEGISSRRLGTLAAGQSAVFDDKIEHLAVESEKNVDQKLAWRQGFIVFSDESLTQVVEEIGRYTTLKFEIDDPKLRAIRIDGYFEVGKVDALLEALQRSFGVRVVRVNDNVVRLSALP